MRRCESGQYQYSKAIAVKKPNFIMKKKKEKKRNHQKNMTNSMPKPLTRVERLEQFLSNMEIPKYWIRVISSFLVP